MKKILLFILLLPCFILNAQNVFINKSHMEIIFMKTTMEKGIYEIKFQKGDTIIYTLSDRWIGITEPIESFYYVKDTCKKHTSTFVTPTELLIYISSTDTSYMKKTRCDCKSYTDAYDKYKALEARKYQIGDSIMSIMLASNTVKPKRVDYQSIPHTRFDPIPYDEGAAVESTQVVPNRKTIKRAKRISAHKKYRMN